MLELTLADSTLVFELCPIFISQRNITNVFAGKNNKTLYETVTEVKPNGKPNRYKKKCEQRIISQYNEYKHYPLGKFLLMLKNNRDDFYKAFLNHYGDEQYCIFSINDRRILPLKGLYAYCLNDRLVYIGICTDGKTMKRDYKRRVNQEYGKIHAKNCYIDRQSTNCHLNSLINTYADSVSFFVCPMDNDFMTVATERKLIAKYNPEWNIQLRAN